MKSGPGLKFAYSVRTSSMKKENEVFRGGWGPLNPNTKTFPKDLGFKYGLPGLISVLSLKESCELLFLAPEG